MIEFKLAQTLACLSTALLLGACSGAPVQQPAPVEPVPPTTEADDRGAFKEYCEAMIENWPKIEGSFREGDLVGGGRLWGSVPTLRPRRHCRTRSSIRCPDVPSLGNIFADYLEGSWARCGTKEYSQRSIRHDGNRLCLAGGEVCGDEYCLYDDRSVLVTEQIATRGPAFGLLRDAYASDSVGGASGHGGRPGPDAVEVRPHY